MGGIDRKIDGIVDLLMEDYAKGRVIDENKMFEYPGKDVVIDILEKLKVVIYPGYYRNSNYRTYTVRNNISILLEDIIYNLQKQTAIVLRYTSALPLPFWSGSRISAPTSRPIYRRSTTATPPPTTRTKSSAPTPGCTPFSPTASRTSCFSSACR